MPRVDRLRAQRARLLEESVLTHLQNPFPAGQKAIDEKIIGVSMGITTRGLSNY